jgi:hypothetical protein
MHEGDVMPAEGDEFSPTRQAPPERLNRVARSPWGGQVTGRWERERTKQACWGEVCERDSNPVVVC